jgi:hypothetical protein
MSRNRKKYLICDNSQKNFLVSYEGMWIQAFCVRGIVTCVFSRLPLDVKFAGLDPAEAIDI